jgi:hypothetical protein
VNSPFESDCKFLVRPVPSLTMVTLAFGITEPEESVTVPTMVPLTACAANVAGMLAIASASTTRTCRSRPGHENTRLIMS